MAALIVGGDRVASFRDYLQQRGFGPIRHWSGRKPGECHRSIPLDTRVVVVVTDRVNHGLAQHARRMAQSMAVPVVFSKHSLGQLSSALGGL